jgi:choline-glycine betaine transporter
VDHEGASRLLVAGRTHVSSKFVWFYQLVKMIMLAVLMYIAIRFGNIRLGQKQDVPEFSNVTYICMTFAPSVGTSLLAYAVSDPMSHRQGNFFANAGYRSQDEIDMFAINMPATTWGVGGFIGIAVVAICMSLAVYRFNLPMTFRSCFYPILGAYTWGWMGDFIDALSIIVTVASMCTMMGTTAIQVVTGLKRLGLLDKNVSEEEIALMQNVAIWVITIVSTVAVIKGLRGGIQFMAVAAVSVGVVLTFLVLVLDDSRFLLNLTVQEIGYFLQHSMIQLNFWTDAFGQLREGSGRAVDDKAADETWMEYVFTLAFCCFSACPTRNTLYSHSRIFHSFVTAVCG